MAKLNETKWGNPRDNQIAVQGWQESLVPVLWWNRVEKKYVNFPLDQVPDDKVMERTFEHTCGLVKAIALTGPEYSRFLLYFDGYGIEETGADKVRFEFSDQISEPTATIRFSGTGSRRGNLLSYNVRQVTLSFKDRDQMKGYVTEQSVAAGATKFPTSMTLYHDND